MGQNRLQSLLSPQVVPLDFKPNTQYSSYNGRPVRQTVSVVESNGKVSTATAVGGKLPP